MRPVSGAYMPGGIGGMSAGRRLGSLPVPPLSGAYRPGGGGGGAGADSPPRSRGSSTRAPAAPLGRLIRSVATSGYRMPDVSDVSRSRQPYDARGTPATPLVLPCPRVAELQSAPPRRRPAARARAASPPVSPRDRRSVARRRPARPRRQGRRSPR